MRKLVLGFLATQLMWMPATAVVAQSQSAAKKTVQANHSARATNLSIDKQKEQRLRWWREARFGMFIHWGLYAVPAGEWKGKPIPGIGEWIMNRAKIPVAEYEPLARQ